MATYTKQPPRLSRVLVEVPIGATPATPQMVQAVVTEDLVNDVDPLDVIGGQAQSVVFNAHDVVIAPQIINAAGANVTYAQLVALIKQAILDQAP